MYKCLLPSLTFALFQLEVKGYNDKQIVLIEKILQKMSRFEIDPKRFEVIKELVSCCSESLARFY